MTMLTRVIRTIILGVLTATFNIKNSKSRHSHNNNNRISRIKRLR